MTHAAAHGATDDETRTATRLFLFAAVLLAVTVVVTAVWGLPGLTVIALIATAVVFVLLMAYAAGF